MNDYIKFYDESPRWLRVVLSALGVPAFLYRLFGVILDKAKDTSKLVYLILNVVPIIGAIIYVIDIVWCALGRKLPVCLADWTGASASAPAHTEAVEATEVKEEKKEETTEAEPKEEKKDGDAAE